MRFAPPTITPESVFRDRRRSPQGRRLCRRQRCCSPAPARAADIPAQLPPAGRGGRRARSAWTTTPNSFEDITTYNNFYEFGTDKDDPAAYSGRFRPQPWTRDGRRRGRSHRHASTSRTSLKPHPLEERIYRLRCVEAWSMVVPWVGFPLGDLLKRFKPTSQRQVRRLRDRRTARGDARPAARHARLALSSRACASTRPCIR